MLKFKYLPPVSWIEPQGQISLRFQMSLDNPTPRDDVSNDANQQSVAGTSGFF